MSLDNFNIKDTHEKLLDLQHAVSSLVTKINQDHQEQIICSGFSEFKKEIPGKFLERAASHLSKKGYFVGVAGVFSAGKSTLINALLREPGMLPTAIHSCTYSLTKIASPGDGDEHIEIKYYSKDDSLRYIVDNPRYGPLIEKRREEYLSNFTSEKAMTILKEVLAVVKEDPLPENQTKRRELEEYVDYLNRFADRLGTSYIDHNMSNMKQYLTTDTNNRGHGHLLLIEEVHLFKKNQLFAEKGIGICDLPGTGAMNPRDTEVALKALRDADLIIMALPPQGFGSDNMMLKKELEQHNNELKNKIFFVINRWDEILADELTEVRLNTMMKEHIYAPIISMSLNPDRVYLTNAKMVELTLLGDRADEGHKRALANMIEDGGKKLRNIPAGLDKDLREKMARVYTNGGVDDLRRDLLRYLERDIAVERLKEIYMDLNRVYSSVRRLLDPERPRIEGLKATQMNYIRQVHDFVDQTQEKFSEHVRNIQDGLKGASAKMLDMAKDKLSKAIDATVKGLNFGRIRAKLQIPAPKTIKLEAINMLKEKVSKDFSEIIQQVTVRHVADAVERTLNDAKIDKILAAVGETLPRNFAEDYKKIMSEFNHSLYEFTLMRANEETWDMQDSKITPQGVEMEWTKQIETEFRGQLLQLFTQKFLAYSDNLKGKLWRYYKAILDKLIEDFESIMADLTENLRGVENISLPVDMLGGEGEEFEDRKKAYKLLEYFKIFVDIEKAFVEMTPRFTAIGVK